jgi:NAD(P)-dependent dehydrogenase (short-subunit alcohol dehydrogenase family)
MADASPKTIVITGASSGIGKATARLFLDKGWNVVATMRNPAAEKDLKDQARLKLIALDVQDPDGPKAAVTEAVKAYGRIDVWLNNAGYSAFGPVEAGRREEIERQFDVDVFGLIAGVQAIAPHFRERKAGVLINISSIGGIMNDPGLRRLQRDQVRGRRAFGGALVRTRDLRRQGQGHRAGRDQDRFRRTLAGRLGRLPRARLCVVHGQGERRTRTLHREFELTRNGRGCYLSGGE